MNSIYAYIKKYAAMLAAQTYAIGPAARLIVETDEGVFGTVKGADLANLGEAEVEKLPLSVLPKGRQGIRAIVISQTPACQEWLQRGAALFPALDDMAQIIGTRAAVIDARKGFQKAVPQLSRVMRTNAGCFMVIGRAPNGAYLGYTLTVGRTPYEAIVAMTVLEKSAEVALLAEKIGKAQRTGGSFLLKCQMNDGTAYQMYVIPSLSIVMAGDSTYSLTDTFSEKYSPIFDRPKHKQLRKTAKLSCVHSSWTTASSSSPPVWYKVPGGIFRCASTTPICWLRRPDWTTPA